MTTHFGDRKLRLIQAIMDLNSEQSLEKIEQEIKTVKRLESSEDFDWSAIKPIRKSISVQEMIDEQNYKPIEKKNFRKQVKKLDIQEPLEELLSMLSK